MKKMRAKASWHKGQLKLKLADAGPRLCPNSRLDKVWCLFKNILKIDFQNGPLLNLIASMSEGLASSRT